MAISKSQWQKLGTGSQVWASFTEIYVNDSGENLLRTVIRNGVIERFSAGMGTQAEINWGKFKKWHGRLSIDGVGRNPLAIKE